MARSPHDYYRTKQTLIYPMRRLMQYRYDYVIDPCCGDNVILDSLGVQQSQRVSNDIDPTWQPEINMNAKQDEFWERHVQGLDGQRLCITNPPFKDAFEILQQAIQYCDAVVFLLRITFIEPTKVRGDWFKENPPKFMVVNPRVSFTEDGKTDSTTTAWFGWGDVGALQPIQVLTRDDLDRHQG